MILPSILSRILSQIIEYRELNNKSPDSIEVTRQEFEEIYRECVIGTEYQNSNPPKEIDGSMLYGIPLKEKVQE